MRLKKLVYIFWLICVAIYPIPFFSRAYAQNTEQKAFNLNGTDFTYMVQKTPEGKDFGYFVPASRWPSAADGSTGGASRGGNPEKNQLGRLHKRWAAEA